jgi:hypothetical protein
MTSTKPLSGTPSIHGKCHVTTISHEGSFWEILLDFEKDPTQISTFRGFLRFSSANEESVLPDLRTSVIIIEDSFEKALGKARSLEEHHLQSLLRSLLPNTTA